MNDIERIKREFLEKIEEQKRQDELQKRDLADYSSQQVDNARMQVDWLKRQNEWIQKQNELSGSWMREYSAFPWNFEGLDGRTAIARNEYGIRMYSDDCFDCRNHEERRAECDLCDMNYIYLLVHITQENPREASTTISYKTTIKSQSKRKEELTHWCNESKEFLLKKMKAVVY